MLNLLLSCIRLQCFENSCLSEWKLLLSTGHSSEPKHILYSKCLALIGGRTKASRFVCCTSVLRTTGFLIDSCRYAHGAAFSIQIHFIHQYFYGNIPVF